MDPSQIRAISPGQVFGDLRVGASTEEIDNRIRSLRQHASVFYNEAVELSRRRNANSPSHKLPAEALQYIFIILARDPARLYDDWDWVTVSQVCQKWRAVAMDTRDIWSLIILTRYSSIRRVEMHLRLSGNANLRVIFKQMDSKISVFKYLDSFKQILAHMDRITELRIEVLETVWNRFSDIPEFQNAAPRLRSLDIRVDAERMGEHDCIPSNFLSANAVEKFYLEKVKFAETLLSLSSLDSLVELTITKTKFRSTELLDTLRLCPNLETLSLNGAWTQGEYVAPSYEQVQLPHLRYLHMDMGFDEICHHFQYLKIPETCDLNINSMSYHDFLETVENDECQFIFNRPLQCKTLHIAICATELIVEAEGTLVGNIGAHHHSIKTRFSHIFFTLDANLSTSVDAICSTVDWIFDNSNLAGSESVQLRLGPEDGFISNDQWSELLDYFHNATYLAISFLGEDSKSEEEFARALRLEATPNAPGDGRTILCPKLIHLSLGLAQFSPDFCLELEHTLRYRNIHDIGIEHLYIHEAFGIKDDHMLIRDLAKCVRHIHWDELDDISDHSSSSDEDNNTPNSDELDSGSESELEDYITEVSDYDYDLDGTGED